MRFSMAGGAVRRCAVPFARGLAVHAVAVVLGNRTVATGAGRLGNPFRMRVFLMLHMAALARNAGVGMRLDLVADLLVTREAELIIRRAGRWARCSRPSAALRGRGNSHQKHQRDQGELHREHTFPLCTELNHLQPVLPVYLLPILRTISPGNACT